MISCVARGRRAGFTLIEIMIVIAIIAILAGIAIPNIREARAEAQLAACRQNILKIVQAVEMARLRCSHIELVRDSGTSPVGNASTASVSYVKLFPYLVDNGYINEIPKCPASESPNGYGYFYIATILGNACHNVSCVCCGYHTIGNQRIKPRWSDWMPGENGNWSDLVEEL